jgi:hypothetical protein
MDTLAMIHQLKVSLWNLMYTYWKTETLFSIRWWSLIAMNFIGYAIWWKFIDKRRLSQLLLFGSLIAVGRIIMDIIGTNTVLWSYDIREIPFFPSPFIHDFTITPLSLMIVYQYSPTWKKFLAWTTVVIAIVSFVFFQAIQLELLLQFHFDNSHGCSVQSRAARSLAAGAKLSIQLYKYFIRGLRRPTGHETLRPRRPY